MTDRVIVFDTTLRDGEQSPGATMNLQEKLRLAKQLEMLGVDVIEAGFPASSNGDFESVKAIASTVKKVQVAALARANQKDIDRAWEAVKDAANPRIHVFIATSPIHMEYKLRKTPEEVLEQVSKWVAYTAQYTKNVEFSAEDASRSDPDFLVKVFSAAIAAGATTINVPDTVGYAQPEEFGSLIRYLIQNTKDSDKAIFSVHCHNDLGLGTANTLSALANGARQAELTLCGIGERAGNSSLEEVVMALRTRKDIYGGIDTGIVSEQLYPSCRLLAHIIGRPISATKPVVGGNAFAHEAGIHQDGMLKNRQTYEILTPESVGRKQTDLVIGKHSGRNAVRTRLEQLGYTLNEDQLNDVFKAVKDLADKKASVYDEDLVALVVSEVYRIPDRYRLINLSVQTAMSGMPATAAVELKVGDDLVRKASFGVGPVDAVFNVISKLVGRTPDLEEFSISSITGGTDAIGEVTVRLKEGRLTAVGRSSNPDVMVASAKAYVDALNRLDHKDQELSHGCSAEN